MSQFNEVAEPIICDAYAEPTHHVPPHLMSNLRKGYASFTTGTSSTISA